MQINLGSRISFWNNLLEICCHKHKSCLLELQWHVNRQIMLLTATSVWLMYVVSHLKLGSLWFILTLNKFQSHTILSHVRSKSPEKYSLDVDDPSESDSLPGLQSDSDPDYLTENDGNHLTNCSRIYDLVRNLVFTKGQAKLQSSRLSYFSSHNRHKTFFLLLLKYNKNNTLLLKCINPFARFTSWVLLWQTWRSRWRAWRTLPSRHLRNGIKDGGVTRLLVDCCWMLQHDVPHASHHRKSSDKKFKPT